METRANSFEDCLSLSHEAAELPLWEETYKQAFPGFIGMHYHESDGWHQRHGIDRSIILANSKQILVDEKVRGTNKKTEKVYADIAIEYQSSVEHNTPGWAEKSLLADYIAYAILPLGKCYLLPVLQMQEAWRKNKTDWIRKYGYNDSQNSGYRTRFCPVPHKELYMAIGRELRVEFEPVEWGE